MRKILLIGCGGAGKSTLAARLARQLKLPLIHLDAHYWQPGWREPAREDWVYQVNRLVQGEAWVMDGDYGNTLELRLAACDTVIFLDLPTWLCLWRVGMRRIRFHHRTRPDMGAGCEERLDLAFLRWVARYRRDRRPGILRRLAAAQAEGKRVVVLASPTAVERFLQDLPTADALIHADGV